MKISNAKMFFFNLTVGWYRDFKHVAFLVFVVFWASLLLFFRILKSEGCCYSLYFSHTTPCWEVILLWVHAPAGEGGGAVSSNAKWSSSHIQKLPLIMCITFFVIFSCHKDHILAYRLCNIAGKVVKNVIYAWYSRILV